MQTDWRTQRRMLWRYTRYDFGNLRILPRRSGKGDTPRPRRQRRREVPPRHVQLSRRMEQRDRHGSQGQLADGGLRAMTLFSIFALRGRDRDNPSLRGRSNENYEQRMELIGRGQTCTITSVQKDNLVLEIYNYHKERSYR